MFASYPCPHVSRECADTLLSPNNIIEREGTLTCYLAQIALKSKEKSISLLIRQAKHTRCVLLLDWGGQQCIIIMSYWQISDT